MKNFLLIILILISQTVLGQFSGGTGTEGDPYQIANATDLATLATNVNAGTTYSGVYFWQTADIDLNVAPYNAGTGWTPIGKFVDGTNDKPFSGRYGVLSGKKITNLFTNTSSNNIGLFGYTLNANIQDVILEIISVTAGSYAGALIGGAGNTYVEGCNSSGSVSGVGSFVGALIGSANNTTVIECSSSGTVSGVNRVGGLIGNKSGNNIESSNSSCTVTGSGSYVGGLIGLNINSSTINSCYSTGSVSGTVNFIGGLVGQNSISSTITDSYSSAGTVQGARYVGGFVGQNYQGSTIQNSYSTNNVSGSSTDIGGFVGGNLAPEGSTASINKCYSTGSVSGIYNLGAFAGTNNPQASINNSYSRGNVTRTSEPEEENVRGNVGGFVGLKYGTVGYCYSTGSVIYSGGTNPLDKGFIGFSGDGLNTSNFFDSETSLQTTGSGATAKTIIEMQTNTTFTNAGWDGAIWNIDAAINNGYPYLDWQNTSGTPLPVELTSFSVEYRVNSVELKWTTATEVNNYGFEIERSGNSHLLSLGSHSSYDEWKTIGFVQGYGNSNSPKEYLFVDPTPPSGKIQYRLKQIDFDGQFEYSGLAEVIIETPAQFSLQQNYPNPFNPITTIKYSIPNVGTGFSLSILKVYDILGSEVAVLVNEMQPAGNYEIQFDGSKLASGVYIYKLQSGNYSSVKKFMLLK